MCCNYLLRNTKFTNPSPPTWFQQRGEIVHQESGRTVWPHSIPPPPLPLMLLPCLSIVLSSPKLTSSAAAAAAYCRSQSSLLLSTCSRTFFKFLFVFHDSKETVKCAINATAHYCWSWMAQSLLWHLIRHRALWAISWSRINTFVFVQYSTKIKNPFHLVYNKVHHSFIRIGLILR